MKSLTTDEDRDELAPQLMPAAGRERLPRRIVQYKGGGNLAGDEAHKVAASGFASGGGALPHLSAIQQSFGKHDIGGVQAHVGGAAAQAASALGASGYASGDSVAFANAPDLRLAAHEAAHVVQQRGGVRLSGGIGAAGDEYERHADEVADLVVRGQSAESALDRYAHRGSAGGPAIQKYFGDGGDASTDTDSHAPPECTPAPVPHPRPRPRPRRRRPRPVGHAPATPAPHMLRQPDPTGPIEILRAQLMGIATRGNCEFPHNAFRALETQLRARLAQSQPGPLEVPPQVINTGALNIRFSLHGTISHSAPTGVQSQTGRGTMHDGRQDTVDGGSQIEDSDQTTDTVGGTVGGEVGGELDVEAGAFEGVAAEDGEASATATGRGEARAQRETQTRHGDTTRGSDSHQGSSGSDLTGRVQHDEGVVQVIVSLAANVEVVRDAWSAVALTLGIIHSQIGAVQTPAMPIGEAREQQQHAAP